MTKVRRRAFLQGAGFALGSAYAATSEAGSRLVASVSCSGAPLKGTFLQPLDALRGRSTEEWTTQLAEMLAYGVDTIYLQWLLIDDVSFVDGTIEGPQAFLGPLLRAAESLGMHVHFGLAAGSSADQASRDSPAALASHLASRRDASLAAARSALNEIDGSPVFAGWYLPDEVDDVSASHPDLSEIWAAHLSEMSVELDMLIPGKDVSVSTYVTGKATPTVFAAFWLRVWLEAPVVAMLQDGVGVPHMSIEEILPYMATLSDLATNLGRRWDVIIELFEQQSGPPINDSPFAARSASFARIAQQIELALSFPEAQLIAFTLPDYLLPFERQSDRALARAYRRRFCQ